MLSNNRPYYTELQTKRRVNDDFDYFKRLHECILTMASEALQEADLLKLFEILEVDLTDEELDDFGDKEYIVWEGVCADVMDNQLERPLGSLKLPVPLKSEYDCKQKLKELIEKPRWTATGKTANDTLIPDMVSIAEIDQKCDFIIFDAKYYNARLEKDNPPKGQPGVESVIKQYLYQLAFQKFIKDHGFSKVQNYFLMPTEDDYVMNKGEVF